MKVTQLHLRDIRCFKELILKLNGQSALLVGDNGDGKSTVLRSLAMGLCDDSSASALFRDLYGESVRRKSKQGTVEVELKDQTGRFRTKTTISSLTNFERVDQALYRLRRGYRPPATRRGEFSLASDFRDWLRARNTCPRHLRLRLLPYSRCPLPTLCVRQTAAESRVGTTQARSAPGIGAWVAEDPAYSEDPSPTRSSAGIRR